MTSPLTDEATRLLEALQQWAAGPHIAADAPECTVCPLCQVLRAVRGVRPEVVEHLAGATTELVAALRAAVEVAGADRTPARTVEKIDIG